jgi:undecaprenyl-diphosphatase
VLELLQAIVLGIVQGLTEFLPVSSSGHLLLGQYFLGLDQDRFGLSFDVALHMGTLVAVVVVFWRDLVRMALAFLRSLRRGTSRIRTRSWLTWSSPPPYRRP